ncbi:MAG: hypothetical protein ACPHLK_04035, partial [Gammaproteobacteria bacterium]
MQIEHITAALRPRNNWEAIDLGFNMAQQLFLPLILLWLASAIPVFLILCLIPYTDIFWTGIIIWWLKPLFEQVQLYYASRALFGEYPKIKNVLKQFWSISKTQIIPLLTYRRLSFSRNFNNPVAMLENLKGKNRKNRLNLLHLTQRNATHWLHSFCYTFEIILWSGFCILLAGLIPEDSNWISFDGLLMFEDNLSGFISTFFYLIAMAIIAPFYVCSGFAMYLTRRTALEGWDIELNFRRIADRLSKLQQPVKICFIGTLLYVLSGTLPEPAIALEQSESEKLIQQVLSQDEFGKEKTVKHWEFINELDKEEDKEFDLSWLIDSIKALFKWFGEVLPGIASLLEFLLWIAVILLILYLVLRFSTWLDWLGLPKIHSEKKYVPPSRLFGMEINKESLPKEIIPEVRSLIINGKIREALSLLYRASLVHLIYVHQLQITESATEGECKRLVELSRPDDEAYFFSTL